MAGSFTVTPNDFNLIDKQLGIGKVFIDK